MELVELLYSIVHPFPMSIYPPVNDADAAVTVPVSTTSLALKMSCPPPDIVADATNEDHVDASVAGKF